MIKLHEYGLYLFLTQKDQQQLYLKHYSNVIVIARLFNELKR